MLRTTNYLPYLLLVAALLSLLLATPTTATDDPSACPDPEPPERELVGMLFNQANAGTWLERERPDDPREERDGEEGEEGEETDEAEPEWYLIRHGQPRMRLHLPNDNLKAFAAEHEGQYLTVRGFDGHENELLVTGLEAADPSPFTVEGYLYNWNVGFDATSRRGLVLQVHDDEGELLTEYRVSGSDVEWEDYLSGGSSVQREPQRLRVSAYYGIEVGSGWSERDSATLHWKRITIYLTAIERVPAEGGDEADGTEADPGE